MADESNPYQPPVETEVKPVDRKVKIVRYVWYVCAGLALIPCVYALIFGMILCVNSGMIYWEYEWMVSGIILSFYLGGPVCLALIILALVFDFHLIKYSFFLLMLNILILVFNIRALAFYLG